MTAEQERERREFAELLDSHRAEVRERRNAVRHETGRAVSPQRMKFLRKMASENP